MRLQLIFFISMFVFGCRTMAQTSETDEKKVESYISTLSEHYSGTFDKLIATNKAEVLRLDSIWSKKNNILLEDSKKERFRMPPWKRNKLANEMRDIERSIQALLLSAKYAKPQDEK